MKMACNRNENLVKQILDRAFISSGWTLNVVNWRIMRSLITASNGKLIGWVDTYTAFINYYNQEGRGHM